VRAPFGVARGRRGKAEPEARDGRPARSKRRRKPLLPTDPKNRRRLLACVDFGLGAAAAFTIGRVLPAVEVGWSWPGEAVIVDVFVVAIVCLYTSFMALGVVGLSEGAWREFARLKRRGRVIVVALVAIALTPFLFTRPDGIPAVRFLVRELPGVFVAACGLWACLLVARAAKARWLRWLSPLPHLIGAATAAASLFLLFDRDLLTTEPAAGFLIPLAVWGSVSAWLAMRKSERRAVRAVADIALSLLLGATLVVFLVWLANLLDMPRPEIAVLRTVLARAGAIVDLPWWVWTVLYALLAGLSVAFVLRPARTATAKEWFGRLRVVPAANAARRVASGVHIGLLAIVLIGLSAPAALAGTVQHKLADAYTVAVQRKFDAAGERAAYIRIRNQFANGGTPGTLVQVFTQIHGTDSPPAGDDNATSDEGALAQRVGALQAAALNLASTKAVLDAAQTAARQAGLDAPLGGARDVADRLTEVSSEDQDADTEESSATSAGESAAAAVASVFSLSALGDNELVQIVQEYLSGLLEESGVKDTFATWVEHLGASSPPTAKELVEPDPPKLKAVAYSQLAAEFAAAGQASDINEDQAVFNASTEPPIAAAVILANQSIQPDITGCPGCTPPGGGDDDDVVPPDDGE
jgi:hypothetical protein